jgi:hypothetical protein
MTDDELRRALCAVALESVAEGRLSEDTVLPGVRALDLWLEEPNGAMLFWIDRDAIETPLKEPELQHVIVTRVAGPWQVIGTAILTVEPWEEFRANVPPGLTRFMGGSAGFRDREDLVSWHSVRLTWATASPEVAAVRLSDREGNIRDRRPGRHGFVLLGITPEDPITYASGLGHAGNEIPGEPILL